MNLSFNPLCNDDTWNTKLHKVVPSNDSFSPQNIRKEEFGKTLINLL